GEAVRHAVWVLNRTSTKSLSGSTPWESAHHEKPNLSGLREWGSKVWVRQATKKFKLGSGRVREGFWMGIDDESPGAIRVYYPDTRSVKPEISVYYSKEDLDGAELEGELEFDELTLVKFLFLRRVRFRCRLPIASRTNRVTRRKKNLLHRLNLRCLVHVVSVVLLSASWILSPAKVYIRRVLVIQRFPLEFSCQR
ncbi:hypothetical protein BDZ89DRAFT_1197660, partial [Hymenopellis radicata]